MKKILMFSALAVIGVIALSSCKKSYDCVDSSGTVLSTCDNCKGLEKDSFDLSCALLGGTVQAQ